MCMQSARSGGGIEGHVKNAGRPSQAVRRYTSCQLQGLPQPSPSSHHLTCKESLTINTEITVSKSAKLFSGKGKGMFLFHDGLGFSHLTDLEGPAAFKDWILDD